MQTVAQLLQWAEAELRRAVVSESRVVALSASADPGLDARWLLAHVLQKNQAWLRAWPDQVVDDSHGNLLRNLIARRCAGEPVAYLTGRQGFWTLDLEVTPDTLVPRPDTERLVECALALPLAADARVLDLGTGTGAIALALASERPGWQVHASDIDANSVALAQRNAVALGLPLVLRQSDWLRGWAGEKFHLIVSNPPYIPAADPHLSGAGVRFEPLRALVAGCDGLDDIRALIAAAPDHLFDGGWLLLEHGFDQGAAVRGLFAAAGWQESATHQDLGGNDRVTQARMINHTHKEAAP